MESEFVLHQFLMLSVGELQIVIEKLPEIIKEELEFEPRAGTAKRMIDDNSSQPTAVEEKNRYALGGEWDCSTEALFDWIIFPRLSKSILIHNQVDQTRDWNGQF